MPFPVVTTASPANMRLATFIGLYIAGVGEKWQTLGDLAEGIMNIESFDKPNSMGKNRSQGVWNFTASCKMKQTSLTELELLDTIQNGLNSFLFKLSDAVTPAGAASEGWVHVTAAQVGVKGRLVADGTPEDDRHILLEFQGSIYASTANTLALLKPTLAAANFEATGDAGTFHAIGVYTAATDGGSPDLTHIRSCGVASLTLDIEGGASPQTMSPISDVKCTVEGLADEDSIRRFLPASLSVNIELDWKATDNADLLLLDEMLALSPKAIITFIDGLVLTLDGKTGLKVNFESASDGEKNRVVRFTMLGKMLNSAFDSVVS
jgi:hypothetical protein